MIMEIIVNLEYTGKFKLGKEEYTEEECRITGKSYSVPIKS